MRQRRPEPNQEDRQDASNTGVKSAASPSAGHGRASRVCRASLLLVIVVAAGLVCVDVFIESEIDPVVIRLGEPPNFTGPLAQNEDLASAERLFENEILGPESLVLRNGVLYTGTADGKIMRVVDGRLELVTTLGVPPCGHFDDEPTCGRPLGMRFDHEGFLIVIDTYLGLYQVDVHTGHARQLFSSTQEVAGKRPIFLNDLDIASDGTIYLSDSSTKWDRRHNRMALMEGKPDGRLLKFDRKTNSMSLIVDGLYFANGVQLSPTEDFLLISETSTCRILRYHLKGPRSGTVDTFADNMPGLPDNVRPSSAGGYWVGIALSRLPGTLGFSGYDVMASRPWLRRLLTKLCSQQTLIRLMGRPHGLLVELNQQGEVVRSLHDPKALAIPASSEVEDHDGVLYIGSYYSPFVGRLDTRQLH